MNQTIQPRPENSPGSHEAASQEIISPQPSNDDVLSERPHNPRHLYGHVSGISAEVVIKAALAQLAAVPPDRHKVFSDIAGTCRALHLPPPSRSTFSILSTHLGHAYQLIQSEASPEVRVVVLAQAPLEVTQYEFQGQPAAPHINSNHNDRV